MKASELPDNLQEYAWAGKLPKKLFKAYPQRIMWSAGISLVLAVIAAGIAYMITGNDRHLIAALPVFTWLFTMSVPLIYMASVRDVRILKPSRNGAYELHMGHWWKSETEKHLDENLGRFEGGRRTFWLIVPHITEEKPDPDVIQFDPETANLVTEKPKRGEEIEIVGAAEVYGLAGYVASGAKYAFTKTLTIRETVKLGVIAAVIAGELLGIYMMSSRLLESDNTQAVSTAVDNTPAVIATGDRTR